MEGIRKDVLAAILAVAATNAGASCGAAFCLVNFRLVGAGRMDRARRARRPAL